MDANNVEKKKKRGARTRRGKKKKPTSVLTFYNTTCTVASSRVLFRLKSACLVPSFSQCMILIPLRFLTRLIGITRTIH